MLAIQQPRMGSSQPAEGAGPFGYSFSKGDDLLFFEPPTPAPGLPLLSQEESYNLNNLLEQLTSNQYSGMSFGEGLNFSEAWQQLPPAFVGSATSYGHQTAQPFSASMFDFSADNNAFDAYHYPAGSAPHHQMMQPPRSQLRGSIRPPLGQNPGADAAAVLTSLQSSQAASSNGIGRGTMTHPQGSTRSAIHPMIQTQNHYTMGPADPLSATSIRSPLTSMPENRDEHLFADMTFGNPHGSRPHRMAQVAEDVRWGTDRSFGPSQSFVPPDQRDTAESLESERIRYLDCLQLSNSIANTRHPSPSGSRTNSPVNGRNGKLVTHSVRPQDHDGPPLKRRKSHVKDEVDEDVDQRPIARKRRSKDNLNGSDEASSSTALPGKRRRKSAVNNAKNARENLSEEAKRRNHIKSEQRRRTVIKTGFEDLTEMVPNLKNGGYSKSTMLQMAGEWLDELIKGNETLK